MDKDADIFNRFSIVFKKALKKPDLEITRNLTSANLSSWTSLNHLQLISGLEKEFKIKFAPSEIVTLKSVGEILDCLNRKF